MIDLQSNLLKFLELKFRKRANSEHDFIPIWIVGAPRSGTTLIYQALCSAFKCYYLTNRVAWRYRIALIVRMIERNFFKTDLSPTSFNSKYGQTKHSSDPHEGGPFFYQFFPKEEPYVTVEKNYRDSRNGVEFKNILSEIAKPYPIFISKNTYHSLRIQVLSELFPSSIFVWVKRDLKSTMKSIYKARQDNNDLEKWWGVNPPGWKLKEKEPVLDQIYWQVNAINQIIKKDLELSLARHYEIDYDDFCENPRSFIAEFADTFSLASNLYSSIINIPENFLTKSSESDNIDVMIQEYLEAKND
ncbi:MAG: sulfotransferase [Balneolaceae bacterium]|nr:sulfotransferase [Balneolaceae bacterium]